MTGSRHAPARPPGADRRPAAREQPPEGSSRSYLVFIYRLPSPANTARVNVWRHLKRLGALSLQQGVSILPHTAATAATLTRVAGQVADAGGTTHLLPLRSLPPAEEAKIVAGFIAQSTRQDETIITACQSSRSGAARQAGAAIARTRGRAWRTDAGVEASGGEAP